jgi:hypothetical protein
MLAHQDARIRERAYAIWEQEGRPQGREWDHWTRAAEEIERTGRMGQADAKIPQKAAAAPKAMTNSKAKGRIRRALKSAMS